MPRALIEGSAALTVLAGPEEQLPAVAALAAAARAARIPVLWVGPPDGGASGHSKSGDHQIRARRHSMFFGTDLSIVLSDLGVRTLILAGGITSVAVHYSFVDAHQNDYFCRVAEDCMAGSSQPAHEAALRAMEYMQSGARRRSAELIAAFDGLQRDQSR